MKRLETIDRATYMMWGAEQSIARASNELKATSDATFRGTSQEDLKDTYVRLIRLVDHDMRRFINFCLKGQNDILEQANRIYGFIDRRDNDGK